MHDAANSVIQTGPHPMRGADIKQNMWQRRLNKTMTYSDLDTKKAGYSQLPPLKRVPDEIMISKVKSTHIFDGIRNISHNVMQQAAQNLLDQPKAFVDVNAFRTIRRPLSNEQTTSASFWSRVLSDMETKQKAQILDPPLRVGNAKVTHVRIILRFC